MRRDSTDRHPFVPLVGGESVDITARTMLGSIATGALPVADTCLITTLTPGKAAWPLAEVRHEMQTGGISRRRAKKRLSARVRRQLRYALKTLPDGGIRLILLTPGRGRSIDLMPFECQQLAALFSGASR